MAHESARCAQGRQARPLPRGHLGHRFALIFHPDFPNIPKISSVRFYPVWNPFDIGFLRNIKHATNRNWHWALDQYVSPKNSIKSCQKVYKLHNIGMEQSKIIDTTETYQQSYQQRSRLTHGTKRIYSNMIGEPHIIGK